jgi:hypothetical protein
VQKSAVKRHILEPLQYGLREDLPHDEKLRGENNKKRSSNLADLVCFLIKCDLNNSVSFAINQVWKVGTK